MMKKIVPASLLLLCACGGASTDNAAANAAASETADAVTAEAVRDTRAATNDAEAAAAAELDRLDDGAPASEGKNKGDRVRNTTAVTVY